MYTYMFTYTHTYIYIVVSHPSVNVQPAQIIPAKHCTALHISIYMYMYIYIYIYICLYIHVSRCKFHMYTGMTCELACPTRTINPDAALPVHGDVSDDATARSAANALYSYAKRASMA